MLPDDFAVLLHRTMPTRSVSCKARAPDPHGLRDSSNCLLERTESALRCRRFDSSQGLERSSADNSKHPVLIPLDTDHALNPGFRF